MAEARVCSRAIIKEASGVTGQTSPATCKVDARCLEPEKARCGEH